jgi:HK97 family phage prohead protease/HK97 family phage major capsid protein
MIRLTAQNTFVLAEDGESPRSISGVAVPWNTEATVSDGTRVRFERGSLPITGKKPKLLKYHDSEQPVGVVTGRLDSEEGMLFTARISATSEGNDMLELIKDEAVDSVSVGVDVVDASYDDNGTMVIKKANWVELSLVTAPAFKGAMITEVAATEPQEETTTMSEVKVEASVEAPAPAPQMLFAAPKKEFVMPTAGEYISKLCQGGAVAAEFLANLKAAAPDVVTTDTPGLLPTPILGPVYNNLIGRRPVIDAIGARAMPGGGKVFSRPKVTTHTTIGASNGENQPLDAGTFVVAKENVTKAVYGGYVKLSEEDIDWSEPEVLGALVDDMSREYGKQTEDAVEAALKAGITTTRAAFDTTDPAEWAAWIYGASQTILNASTHLPTHLFASPSFWGALGQLSDTADRPLFPQVGPMNAFGNVAPGTLSANAFGLSVVVCPYESDFLAIGAADGFEIYEQQKGAIQVEATDGSLSRIIKFRGYLATLMLDASKFVEIA